MFSYGDSKMSNSYNGDLVPEITEHANGRIDPTRSGYYYEFSICNASLANIAIIDQWGKVFIVEPNNLHNYANTGVYLYTRTHSGLRVDTKTHREVPVKMREILVRTRLYEQKGFYLEDEKLLICLESQIPYVKHPELIVPYTVVHNEMIKAAVEEAPKLIVTANNPKNETVEPLYCCLFDKVVTVSCTNYPAASSTFTISLATKEETSLLLERTFDPIALTNLLEFTISNETVVLGLSKKRVKTHYDTIKKNKLFSTRDDFDKLIHVEIDRTTAELHVEINKEKQKREVEKEQFKTTIEELELRNKKLEADLARADLVLNGARGIAEIGKQDLIVKTLDEKHTEQVEKTSRAKIATGGEALKILPTVLKFMAGVVVGVASFKILTPIKSLMALASGIGAFFNFF